MAHHATLHVVPVPDSFGDAQGVWCADAAPAAADSSAASPGHGTPVGKSDFDAAEVATKLPLPLATRPRAQSGPRATTNHDASTQQTLVAIVSDGDEDDLAPGTLDQFDQALRQDLLSGLNLDEPLSRDLQPPFQDWDLETDLDEGAEEHGSASRPSGRDTLRLSLAAIAPIHGEGLPTISRQLGPPKASVITDLGEQMSTMRIIRRRSSPDAGPVSGALGQRLHRAMARVGPYEDGFVPKGQLQSIVSKEAVEVQLAECEASLRWRVRRLRSRTPGPRPRADLRVDAQRICGEGEQTWPVYSKTDSAAPDLPRKRPSEMRFLKIMAILCLIEQPSGIWAFMKEGVCDADLPLVRDPTTINTPGAYILCPRKDPNRQLLCFEGWKPGDVRRFEQRQWSVLAPFFGRELQAPTEVKHYSLPKGVILPFVTWQCQEDGGFGRVYKALIHPDHHDFSHLASQSSEPNVFAVKQLISRNQKSFKHEVEVLRRVSRRPHPHLINLLATYEYHGRYHLLFPWAEANLLSFWENEVPQYDETGSTVRWVAEQCRGLASGLSRIHRYQRTSTDSIIEALGLAPGPGTGTQSSGAGPQPPGEQEQAKKPKVLFCRHGDIKPENILWFPGPAGRDGGRKGVLKISDFGVAQFSIEDSAPRTEDMPTSLLYEPPEAYGRRAEGVISTTYDVWGLGCIFLEFLAWYCGGWKYVSYFLERRMVVDDVVGSKFDPSKFRSAGFYVMGTNSTTGMPEGKVKGSVHQFIDELHSHPRCTEFIHDLLGLIRYDMLVVEGQGQRRIHSAEVSQRLEGLQRRGNRSPGYFTCPAPWPAP